MHERRTDDAEASSFAALLQRVQAYGDEVRPALEAYLLEVRPELDVLLARVRDLPPLVDLSAVGPARGPGG